MKKTKMTIATISLILTLTFAATFVALMPVVNAQEADTYTMISVSPNPVGIGQTTFVVFWLTTYPPTAAGAGGDRWTFTIDVTKPDGSTETRGPITSDPVGGRYIIYTPDQQGTYTFQAHFPGKTLEAGENPHPAGLPFVGTYFKPSTSNVISLTVQKEKIEEWPGVDLPVDYWERPISSELKEWTAISGNWLMGTSNYAAAHRIYNPYTTSPKTSHVVWTKELTFGGVIGGESGKEYYTGITYESKWGPPIVMQGKLYYNLYPATPPLPGFACVDLRTGETLYTQEAKGPGSIIVSLTGFGQLEARPAEGYPRLAMGQIYIPETPNQHGGIPYLWTTSGPRWDCYDAITGAYLYSLNNTIGTTTTFGPSGEILGYTLSGGGKWLAMWNSSKVEGLWGGTAGTEAWQWRPPVGETLDFQTGLQWNKTLPGVEGPAALGIQAIDTDNNIIVAAGAQAPFIGWGDTVWLVGYDATTGEQLWVNEVTTPFTATLGGPPYGANIVASEGIFAMYEKETMRYRIFDINNGNELRYTDPRPGSEFGHYIEGGNIAYGKLYSAGYDGLVCCWDLNTGKLEWSYSAGVSGLETVYGSWPLTTSVIADGKIYAYTNEHSPGSRLYKGAKLHCIDAETGEGLWALSGWWGHTHYGYGGPAIADGYLVVANYYDGLIYCIGKGETETTVSASPAIIPDGSSVLITGTVTDQSPGAEGTPAIADEDMTAWMEYLYQQKPMPMDATGVPVTLDAIDPNGNYISIGRVTSDMSGMFKKMWTPETEGEYTIIATFEGSDSYWSSYAETAIGVGPAVSPAGPIEPEPGAPFITTEIAIIAVVAVVAIIGVVAFWVLRKRKK